LVDEFACEDLGSLPDARAEEDFEELQRGLEALEVERLRRLGDLRRRRIHERDGHASMVSWLASRFRMAFGMAAQLVRLATALEVMPLTRRALSAGDITPTSAHVLAAAREADPESFVASEELLVGAAASLPIRRLQQAVAYWRMALDDRAGVDRAASLRARRHLHVSATIFGMVRVDGDLDPETGQTFMTALGAVCDAEARIPGDDRTPGQRRADALGELARQFLDRGDRPQVAGERPHVVVTVDLAALRGQPGGRSALDDVGPIHAETARRLACDAGVTRVITSGRSEPLDIGRRTPVVPPSLRRALVVRDGGRCQFPGCDRPQSWCDAHHVVHWADGGPTALSNLVLLCRRHHRATHGGFTVRLIDGVPVFRRPDGSELSDRGPPPR
jgi:hypothetical protein